MDLKKSFDLHSLTWDTILETFKAMAFSPPLREMISNCIKFASSVTICHLMTFQKQRGVATREPISPILFFNLVVDVLSRLLLKGVNEKRID